MSTNQNWEYKLAEMIKQPAKNAERKQTYSTGVVTEANGVGFKISTAQGQVILNETNCTNPLEESLTVGDTVVLLGSYLNGQRPVIIGKNRSATGDTYNSPFSTAPEIQNEILRCALTYYRKQHNLIYGNSYTANNYARNPQDTPHRNTDGSKRYEIDCSSFAQLVTGGIDFEDSRYNPDNTNNTRKHDWGFDWANKEQYYCKFEANQERMLAHDLAAYCRDRGWLFKPRPNYDFSNLQTGDLLFFQQTTDEHGYWENIRHVGIFLWVNGYGNIMLFDASTSHPAGVMVVRTRVISTPYASQIVWVGRLPFNSRRSNEKPNDILKNPEDFPRVWKDGERTVFLGDIKLKENIAPYNYYSIAVKLTQDESQYPQDICLRLSGMNDTMDRKMRPYTIEPDGTYYFKFFITDDDCVANRPDGELEISGYDHSHILLCGYAYDEEGEFISEGAPQINTQVHWVKVFKGLWNADRTFKETQWQEKLTAGANITIDENNVISATGGGGGGTYTAGKGIKIQGATISANPDGSTVRFNASNKLEATSVSATASTTYTSGPTLGSVTIDGTTTTFHSPYWVAATGSVITVGTTGQRREIDMQIDETRFSWWPEGGNEHD